MDTGDGFLDFGDIESAVVLDEVGGADASLQGLAKIGNFGTVSGQPGAESGGSSPLSKG